MAVPTGLLVPPLEVPTPLMIALAVPVAMLLEVPPLEAAGRLPEMAELVRLPVTVAAKVLLLRVTGAP